jgi:hypothetical protein
MLISCSRERTLCFEKRQMEVDGSEFAARKMELSIA